jgi:hypothetical protein
MQPVRFLLSLIVGTLLAPPLLASSPRNQTEQVSTLPPVDVIRRAVQAEADAQNSSAKYIFSDRKQTPHGSQTRLMVETVNAMAAITVAYDDKPLTAEQRQAELDRLHRLASSPDELKKKHQQELENSDRVNRIVKALPDAFLYEYAGTETGRDGLGVAGKPLLRLTFKPRPDYDPPSQVERVLVGMEGYVLVDAATYRIAKIDGTLTREVGFGWGILGHLDRGGRFVVEQGQVDHDTWEITRMELSFTGRILLFKSINIQSTEVFSNFQPVSSNLTFAQAVDLLASREAMYAARSAGS